MVSKIPSSCLYKKQFPCQNHLLFKVFLWVFLPKDLLLSYTKETKKLHSFKQNHSYYTKKMPFLIDRSAFQIGIMQFCIDQCSFAITRKWLNSAKKIAYSQRTCKNANYYANMQINFCYASPTILYFLHFLEIVDWSVCKTSATFAPLLYFAIYCCNNFLS